MAVLKFVVIGPKAAGKTSFIKSYISNFTRSHQWKHDSESEETYEILLGSTNPKHQRLQAFSPTKKQSRGCFGRMFRTTNALPLMIQFWDIPSTQLNACCGEDNLMLPHFEFVQAFFYVADASDKDSLQDLPLWREALSHRTRSFQEIPFVLVLHKSDKRRRISSKTVKELRLRTSCTYYEFTTLKAPKKIISVVEKAINVVLDEELHRIENEQVSRLNWGNQCSRYPTWKDSNSSLYISSGYYSTTSTPDCSESIACEGVPWLFLFQEEVEEFYRGITQKLEKPIRDNVVLSGLSHNDFLGLLRNCKLEFESTKKQISRLEQSPDPESVKEQISNLHYIFLNNKQNWVLLMEAIDNSTGCVICP